MAEETEHRYLVRSDEWKQKSPRAEHLLQGYLSLDETRSVRVRTTDKTAFITVKGNRDGLTRSEFEYPVPFRDASQILEELCVKPLISKTRYKVRQDGQLWEIDEFEGENKGLVIAEVEVKPGAKRIKKPAWVGEEISGQERFDNIKLIREPFETWPENGGQPEATFHLKPSESIPEGISRTLHEQLRTSMQALSQGAKLDEAVHEARKSLKKTRSILRLGRSALEPAYGDANAKLRELGRKLSPVRDAAALVEMVEHIQRDEQDPRAKAAVERVLKTLRDREEKTVQELVGSGEKGRVAEALNEIISDSAAWPVEKIDFGVIVEGMKTTIKRGKRALEVVNSHRQADNFHAWRKRAKDLRYQLSFLKKLWPEVFEGYANSAEDLEQKLGDDHNLAVLSDQLGDLKLPKREAATVASIITERQKKLREEALEVGRLLYAEGSNRWAKRLEHCWKVQH